MLAVCPLHKLNITQKFKFFVGSWLLNLHV